jgi:hypothetical protein
MTIARLKWADTAATDLHLIPGLSSPELVRLLRVDDLTGETLTPDQPLPAGATVTFTPQLKVGVDHGIELTAAGEVTVKTLALRGHSFLLNVSLDQDPAITTRVRIHVHEKVSSLWLTPSRLTVRQGSAQARFSVLGLFDQVLDGNVVVSEGVIGDITNWSPFRAPDANELTYVHLAHTTTAALTWAATGGPITVDARTGVLTAPVESGPDTKVTATAAGLHADGTAVSAPSWSTHVRLAHLGGPGVKQVDTVPNILFLPDGFQDTAADKAQYNRLVGIVKDRLESRPHTRPFAALTGRVNYWRGWVPSPDAGVTVLDELDPSPAPGELPKTAVPLALPSEARPAAGWSLADVVNAIGLPNPADYPTGTTVESKIGFLQNLYGDSITADLLRPRFAQWVALNDRLLLNERDTAFHMAFSERPSADANLLAQYVSTNPRRISDNDFNKFLDALRGENDDVLPAGLWSTGKDRNRVIVLCRSSRTAGLAARRKVSDTSTGITIGVSLAARPFHQVRLNDRANGFDLKPDDIPTDVFYAVWLTVAHELGHSFGLGDEYGGRTAAPTPLKIRQVRATPNVQDRASLSAGRGAEERADTRGRRPAHRRPRRREGKQAADRRHRHVPPPPAGHGRGDVLDRQDPRGGPGGQPGVRRAAVRRGHRPRRLPGREHPAGLRPQARQRRQDRRSADPRRPGRRAPAHHRHAEPVERQAGRRPRPGVRQRPAAGADVRDQLPPQQGAEATRLLVLDGRALRERQ